MIKVSYWTRWCDGFNSGVAPLTERQARSRHKRKKLYAAYLANDAGNDLFIHVCATDCIQVNFLDEQKRCALFHGYDLLPEGRLFLDDATEHVYRGDERDVHWGRWFSYKQDGSLWVRQSRMISPFGTDYVVDVSDHYIAPVPPFGEYEPFLRRDRHALPPDLPPAPHFAPK